MSQIQEIKDSISLVEIVSESVKLTPAGNYFRGLCPFHHEKSPSFFVNESLGYYKCFGCGEHGDVFTFLQKIDNLTFREALEVLAKRAGIVLQSQFIDPNDKLRQRILTLLEDVTNYYQQNLAQNPACQNVRDYLKKRGVTASSQKLFRLGSSENAWQKLTDYLKKKGYSQQEMLGSGLIGSNHTGRLFDYFRARLMFPLKNHRGQVVGFSGRLIDDNLKEAKYINTPETLVYHKGRLLYGLSELNQEIKKVGFLLAVEGEFDVISSLQAKVSNVVAIKGSAFTTDQAKLISRYVKKVVLALDSDQAGVTATKKAIPILREVGVDLEVIMLAQGKDPDELARTDPVSWRQQVAHPISVFDFFLTITLAKYNPHRLNDQKLILQELADVFALIDNQLEYEYFLKKLAAALNQDKEILRADLKHWHQLKQSQISPKATSLPPTTPKRRLTKLARLEAYLWFLFLHSLSQKTVTPNITKYLITATWDNPFLSQLAQYLKEYLATTRAPTLKGLQKILPQDFREKIALLSLNETFMKYLIKIDLHQEWAKKQAEHQRVSHQKQIKTLSVRLGQLDALAQLTPEQETEKTHLLEQIKTLTVKKSA
jgi:DNA primase